MKSLCTRSATTDKQQQPCICFEQLGGAPETTDKQGVGGKKVGEKNWLTRVGGKKVGEKNWLTRVGGKKVGGKNWKK